MPMLSAKTWPMAPICEGPGTSPRPFGDGSADLALDEDAVAGAQVDGVLQQRHEHHLRNEEGDAEQRQVRMEEEHVADDARQDTALQQRLGDADADEAADRFGLFQDQGDLQAGIDRPRRGERPPYLA